MSFMPHIAAIYARISVTSEESVSVDRQLESARQYAAARDLTVAGAYIDDGVSATHNAPEDRPGWAALLADADQFDAVIVWKVDRLARRVLDFLNADAALQAKGAGIVCVAQPIDMTTPEGRGFATMLAVFSEMEAGAIGARVAAARTHLIQAGRVVGGTVPYGWRTVPNPAGAGRVLAQDPERIDYVRAMATRVRQGHTVYSVKQWLDAVGAPLPTASQAQRKRPGWNYFTVERLLRSPVLAGMTAYNPGNATRTRGTGLLRDTDGLPVVDAGVAIMQVDEWRAMVSALDSRDSAQSKPRAMKSKTSPLLSGLLRCGHCRTPAGAGVRMHRGTIQGRPMYTCPRCHQTVSRPDAYVVAEFLRLKGPRHLWGRLEEVHDAAAAVLPEIEHRMQELAAHLAACDDEGEAVVLHDLMAALRRKRVQARNTAPTVELREIGTSGPFASAWAAATTVAAQRAVLDDALLSVTIVRGKRGRYLDPNRFIFDWVDPDRLGPEPEPDGTWLP